ncbi:MAG TPA: PP2C family protein-serine/threonine phosphatase [Vicinamibacterales bacterium]|nr:PP2C family protein-serine/threonine phosphatase [Vicinamibacterales bacterium]
MAPAGRAKSFLDEYTRDLTPADFQRLFTRDTAEAYRYFTRHSDAKRLAAEPWFRRWAIRIRLVFIGFTMRLSPARRALYGLAVVSTLLGAASLFRGFEVKRVLLFPFTVSVPLPSWADGTVWLLLGFVAVNLLILMEVADRLSLKGDLEIARDIQLAMLPGGVHVAGDASVCGVTRPANTVGGDFYDVIPLADGRLVIALGDVAGKGSPAALLMALLLAMLRTLVDEGLEAAKLMERLNAQVARHSPASRFITFFFGLYEPATGVLQYVNAGHLPPVIRRADGRFERITGNTGSGLALGMFEQAKYATNEVTIGRGDVLVMYTDGITEAEDNAGQAFEDAGLEQVITSVWMNDSQQVGRGILEAVERYSQDVRLVDDLTALVLKRAVGDAGSEDPVSITV